MRALTSVEIHSTNLCSLPKIRSDLILHKTEITEKLQTLAEPPFANADSLVLNALHKLISGVSKYIDGIDHGLKEDWTRYKDEFAVSIAVMRPRVKSYSNEEAAELEHYKEINRKKVEITIDSDEDEKGTPKRRRTDDKSTSFSGSTRFVTRSLAQPQRPSAQPGKRSIHNTLDIF